MKATYDKRPWGLEEILTINEPSTVKILTINPGQRTSLQYHNHRKEFWKIIQGEAIFEIDGKKIDAKIGDEMDIDTKMTHRLIGKDEQAKILEISFGKFDENDITRLEDDYGRIK
jgi:mannose-6-phosphate isomerase-like protein (cupin superfamily)